MCSASCVFSLRLFLHTHAHTHRPSAAMELQYSLLLHGTCPTSSVPLSLAATSPALQPASSDHSTAFPCVQEPADSLTQPVRGVCVCLSVVCVSVCACLKLATTQSCHLLENSVLSALFQVKNTHIPIPLTVCRGPSPINRVSRWPACVQCARG